MQTVQLTPSEGRIRGHFGVMALLVFLAVLFPVLSLPAALVMPLWSCPLRKKNHRIAGAVLSAGPGLAAFFRGAEPLLALTLVLLSGLPLLIAYRPQTKRRQYREASAYMVVLALAFCAVGAVFCKGERPRQVLAGLVMDFVEKSPRKPELLLRMALLGLASIPEGLEEISIMSVTSDPALCRELFLSAQAGLEDTISKHLSLGIVQAPFVVGLFTALRVSKSHGSLLLLNKTRENMPSAVVAVPPGFRMLTFSQKQMILFAVLLAAVYLFKLIPSFFCLMLSSVMISTLRCSIQLLGAAVLIFRFAPKPDDKVLPFGILAAVLYLVLPAVLGVLGLGEIVFRFRSRHSIFHF